MAQRIASAVRPAILAGPDKEFVHSRTATDSLSGTPTQSCNHAFSGVILWFRYWQGNFLVIKVVRFALRLHSSSFRRRCSARESTLLLSLMFDFFTPFKMNGAWPELEIKRNNAPTSPVPVTTSCTPGAIHTDHDILSVEQASLHSLYKATQSSLG